MIEKTVLGKLGALLLSRIISLIEIRVWTVSINTYKLIDQLLQKVTDLEIGDLKILQSFC